MDCLIRADSGSYVLDDEPKFDERFSKNQSEISEHMAKDYKDWQNNAATLLKNAKTTNQVTPEFQNLNWFECFELQCQENS